jgi:hypothetical protein
LEEAIVSGAHEIVEIPLDAAHELVAHEVAAARHRRGQRGDATALHRPLERVGQRGWRGRAVRRLAATAMAVAVTGR